MAGKEKRLALISVILFIAFFVLIDIITGQIFIPRNYSEFRIRSAVYHHGLEKDVNSIAAWGPILYPFYTNNLGFRDFSNRQVSLTSDKKRILILGDSHSEGVGIDYPFTYAGLLQERAEKKGVEILNASAVSYSPRIHWLKGDYLLNTLGLEVDEIWLVIDISDLQNEIAYASFVPSQESFFQRTRYKANRFLKANSLTWSTLDAINRNREFEVFNQTLLGFQKNTEQLPSRTAIELYKEFFRHMDDEDLLRDPNFHGVSEWIYNNQLRELAQQGLDLGMKNIKGLKEICDEKGINLRLSVHPWQTQVLKGDTTDYYVETWRSFCNENEIDFINLFPVFINHENPREIISTCYIEGDNHWSEPGHLRVADYLQKYIEP